MTKAKDRIGVEMEIPRFRVVTISHHEKICLTLKRQHTNQVHAKPTGSIQKKKNE